MKAIVVRAYGGPENAVLDEVQTPQQTSGEVLVKVRAVTVNRTRDLNVIGGEVRANDALPLVPGQDPAGEVVELGPDVTTCQVGDRVIVSSWVTCESCAACRAGRTSDCARSVNLGIHRWGGYAEYIAAPARVVYPIAERLSFAEAAVAMRHFPQAFQQLDAKAQVECGEWVLVMGASGGLGSACVQVAKHRGATVIAGAGSDDRVAAAMALGADYGVNYRRQDLTARVKELTEGRGVDIICEDISDPTTFPAAFACLARYGRLVTSGAHGGGNVTVNMRQLYGQRQKILGVAGQNCDDIVKAMDGAGNGTLKAMVELVLPLAKLHAAFDMINDRSVTGKIVIDPQAN